MDTASLDARFGQPGHLSFRDVNGVTVLDISNRHGNASVALQGAHVMQWTPQGQRPVIWLSSAAKLAQGKSIRGGVPVCWPWFGAHEQEAAFPAHGFARTVPWALTTAAATASGGTRLSFTLPAGSIPPGQWPHPCTLELHIHLDAAFEAELVTRNTGAAAFTLGEALHTYFAVGDVRQARVHGLEGVHYLDKADNWASRTQSGPVTISAEVDRLYNGTEGECVIEDPALGRCIRIAKRNSRSTVVWNPWIEKAAKMGDLGEDGYLRMLCVESANAGSDAVAVPPGGEHRLWVRYGTEAL